MAKGKKRLIALDVMDTLIHDPWREALQAASGLLADEISRRQDTTMWHKLELGDVDEAAYWQNLKKQGIAANQTTFHQVRRQGYAWLPGAQELLHELRASGHQVVLASNYTPWFQELKTGLFAAYNLPAYVSYQLGFRKPSIEFFAPMLRDHHASFAELLLIDDSPASIQGIKKAGGEGILHTSGTQTRIILKELGIL